MVGRAAPSPDRLAALWRPIGAFGALIALCVLALMVDLPDGQLPLPSAAWRPAAPRLGLDLAGGTRVVLSVTSRPGATLDDRTLEAVRRIVGQRLSASMPDLDAAVSTLHSETERFIAVDLAGIGSTVPPTITNLLQRTGALTLFFFYARPHEHIALAGHTVLARGDEIEPRSVSIGVSVIDNTPAVDLALTAAAAARVNGYVTGHPNGFIGIALDRSIYLIRPASHVMLNAQFQIIGVPTTQAVDNLAIILRYGALPAAVQTVAVQPFTSTLAADLPQALLAAATTALAVALVALIGSYGWWGLLGAGLLVGEALMGVALVKMSDLLLTPASLAGAVLALALALASVGSLLSHLRLSGRRERLALWPNVRDLLGLPLLLCGILYWAGSTFAPHTLEAFSSVAAIGAAVALGAVLLVDLGLRIPSSP